jgi:hypothetical protein
MMLAVILAQAEGVPSEYLKNFALVVAGVAATAYYVKVLFWGDSPRTPQPLEVREAKDFVHKEEFNKHVEEDNQTHRDLFSKIGGVERGAREHLDNKLDAMQQSEESGREKLHGRINEILKEVGKISGELSALRTRK